MSLREEIADWRQPDGLIVPKSEQAGTEKPDTTGDGIKWFCLYHYLLVKRGESRPEDLEEFERVIKSCFVSEYPGLMRRSPTKLGEQVSKDALIAAAFTAKILKSRLAWVILDRGNYFRFMWMKWFYPNLWPEYFENGHVIPLQLIFSRNFWEAWMGKNPEVITHLQWCGLPAGYTPSIFRIMWQSFYFMIVSVKKESLVSLNEMMSEAHGGGSRMLTIAVGVWRSRVENAWPGGIKQVLEQELEPSHPIAKYWI